MGMVALRRLAAWLAIPMVALAAVSASACGGGNGSDSGSPTARSTPVPSPTGAPSSASNSPSATPASATATPQPSFEPIVQALLSSNWSTIEPLLQRRAEPCTRPFTISSTAPPCPEGAPSGTPVEIFPAAGCHQFMSEDEARAQFEAAVPGLRLYAVYRSAGQHPRVERLPTGDVGIVLERGSLGGQIFTVAGGRIVGGDFGCGIPAAEVVSSIPSNAFMMAPPGKP